MKKLIVGMFALCAAVAAQAAYVDWQYSVSEAKSGGTDWRTGHTAYLIEATAWDSIKDNFDQATLAAAATDSSAFYQASSSKSAIVYTTGSAAPGGVRQATADSGNYYVILATADGYNIAVNNVAVTAYADSTGAGTGLTPGITFSASNSTAGASITYTTYPTPEPTSGLLLLVGAGLLGLRRKQK